MKSEQKIKTEDIFAVNVFELDIHNLANMNPMQSADDFLSLKYSISQIGQQDPIVLFKGKVVDGRNRCLALKELYTETEEEKYKLVKFKKLPTTLSLGELEEIIIGKDVRRHKTSVQKAVQALNYYEIKKSIGETIGMRESAKKFGVTQGTVSKILSLRKVAGEAVVQKLFNGDSINILKAKADGTVYQIKSTSPDAIRKHYEGMLKPEENKEQSIDALEMAYAQLKVTELLSVMSFDGLSYLMAHLQNARDVNKTSYDTEVVNKELNL